MWKSPGTRSAAVLGFALGGFFDGILLHQILQRRHLLSLVPGVSDMRLQVLWDGHFHALMYLVAALALWGLWGAHRRGGEACGRPLVAALLVAFGVWHIAGAWSLGPPPDQPFTTVVLAPGLGMQDAMAAVRDAEARIVWTDPAMGVLVVDVARPAKWSFYRSGACWSAGQAFLLAASAGAAPEGG